MRLSCRLVVDQWTRHLGPTSLARPRRRTLRPRCTDQRDRAPGAGAETESGEALRNLRRKWSFHVFFEGFCHSQQACFGHLAQGWPLRDVARVATRSASAAGVVLSLQVTGAALPACGITAGGASETFRERRIHKGCAPDVANSGSAGKLGPRALGLPNALSAAFWHGRYGGQAAHSER